MGQCAELSQWKPLFFCPVRMSQMMMACGSSLVSISGLKVTTYLENTTTHGWARNKHNNWIGLIRMCVCVRCWWCCLPLTWWEVDEGDTLMTKPLNLFEFLATPQGNATLVEGSQVGAFRRPTHIRLRPALHEHTTVFTYVFVCLFCFFKWAQRFTYGSFFNCDRVLGVIIKNCRPLTSFIDHAVLVTTVWILNPVAQISLNRQMKYQWPVQYFKLKKNKGGKHKK